MYQNSLLPVLLPIILFIFTLMIIFILRAKDKRGRSISNVKKLFEHMVSEIENSRTHFRQDAEDLENKVAKKQIELKDMIQTINGQLGELKGYSEDLGRLRSSMDTYREALEGLAQLTHDADDKVALVQGDVDRLDKVRDVIDSFRQDMKDADEHLRKHEQRVIQLERESISRMNDAVSETDSSMDEAMAGLNRESQEVLESFRAKTEMDTQTRLKAIDDAFQAVIHTVQEFFNELDNKLEVMQSATNELSVQSANTLTKIGERGKDLLVESDKLVQLKTERDSLLSELSSLREEKQIIETIIKKETEADEADEKLASSKQHYFDDYGSTPLYTPIENLENTDIVEEPSELDSPMDDIPFVAGDDFQPNDQQLPDWVMNTFPEEEEEESDKV